MMQKIIILLTYIFTFLLLSEARGQGLRFPGNETDISARSALTVPHPDAPARPVSDLKVRFSMRVNNPSSSGFVFGIKNGKDNSMINLMLRYDHKEDSVWLSFAKEGERELCSVGFAASELTSRRIPLELAVNKSTDSAKVSIDSREFKIADVGLGSGLFEPQLNFGLTRHIVETASVTVYDLNINMDGKERRIPLNESSGGVVHDASGEVAGVVFHPLWQINEAYYWQKIASFSSSTPTGCSFDPFSQRFYSYNRDSLTTFDPKDHSLSSIPLKGRGELPTIHGMNFFNSNNGKIYPYEIYYNNFSAEIDPRTGDWRVLAATDDDKALHHHAQLLSRDGFTAFLFGGYGDRRYYNNLVRFNLHTHRFDTVPLKGDRIPPRFFASMAFTATGDTIYLYGGKGNHEGKQDLGVKYYYDLYLINLNDSSCRRLWRQEAPEKDRVPARTLLLDNKAGCMYAMTYSEYRPHTTLQLYRISLADGSETAVGDTIPMISEEIATNVALHQSTGGDHIYCVIQEFAKEGATDTRIYSIAAPPVSQAQLNVYSKEERNWKQSAFIISGIFLILGASATALINIRRRRRRRDIPRPKEEASQELITEPQPTVPASTVVLQEEEKKPVKESEEEAISSKSLKELKRKARQLPELPSRNRISLFGAFTAIDASGVDVSHLFSPKLRLLFIYILMKTLKKGGVSSSDLSAVFWPDKEPAKIKNLRNVTMAKLRKILVEFKGLEIVYENGLFSTIAGDGFYCDVWRLYSISDSLLKRPSSFEDEDTDGPDKDAEALAIVAQGKFLQGLESPELDRFKSTVESFALELAVSKMTEAETDRCWEEVAICSRIALQIDPLSEPALEKGVKAYMAMDNKGRSRSLYDNFILNYGKIYGEDFPRTFADLIKN